MAQTKKIFIGGVLLIGQSLSTKAIGLISTLILARVLVPDDFGLVAIATILFGFVQVLATTGSMQYLLSVDEIDEATINTSWTLDLLLKLPLSLIFAFSGSYISQWYGDDRLLNIVYVFAGLLLISCLKTPAEPLLRREQTFSSMVKLAVFSKTVSVSVAVTIALVFESYWALVLGQVTNGVIECLGSYLIHQYRPWFSLAKFKEQWRFSCWMLPQAIIGFFRTQLDTIIVSTSFNKGVLGSYHVMKYLAYIPSAHIILPATQPLLVELRNVKTDAIAFTNQFNISFVMTMMIAIPICSLLLVYHGLFTIVILGEQWQSYSVLLSAFSVMILAMAIFQQCQRVLIIHSKTKFIFFYELVSFSILYTFLLTIGIGDILMFSIIRVAIELFSSILLFSYITAKYTSTKNLFHIFFVSLPILFSSLVAILFTRMIETATSFNFLNLCLVSGAYLCVFLLGLAVLYLSGLAKTAEYEYLLGLFLKFARVTRNKLRNS
jgi:lipopolysaccharide exporter